MNTFPSPHAEPAESKEQLDPLQKPDAISECKQAINNVIWMYGRRGLTLEKAEELACDFIAKLSQA